MRVSQLHGNLQHLEIHHPLDQHQLFQRDQLLQTCLRPDPVPFSISAEYPIVLAENAREHSFCVVDNNQVIAHANLWPRHIVVRGSVLDRRIGLIGNVATDPQHQGRGIMHQLFECLSAQASQLGCELLLLWSDLDSFYHKLGFQAWGSELRYGFGRSILGQYPLNTGETVLHVPIENISPQLLTQLLQLRPKVPVTVARSGEEFVSQLHIPATQLFILTASNKILGYFVLGKGVDMMQVIHEWGAASADILLRGLAAVYRLASWEELILLCPTTLTNQWADPLQQASNWHADHAMALGKLIAENAGSDLADTFIWGLDSI